MGFQPEIFDRIGTAKFQRNQVIDFVITTFMRCDAVFSVNFAFHVRRNVTHLFGVSTYAQILHRDFECVSRRQIRIGFVRVSSKRQAKSPLP